MAFTYRKLNSKPRETLGAILRIQIANLRNGNHWIPSAPCFFEKQLSYVSWLSTMPERASRNLDQISNQSLLFACYHTACLPFWNWRGASCLTPDIKVCCNLPAAAVRGVRSSSYGSCLFSYSVCFSSSSSYCHSSFSCLWHTTQLVPFLCVFIHGIYTSHNYDHVCRRSIWSVGH